LTGESRPVFVRISIDSPPRFHKDKLPIRSRTSLRGNDNKRIKMIIKE